MKNSSHIILVYKKVIIINFSFFVIGKTLIIFKFYFNLKIQKFRKIINLRKFRNYQN